MPTLTPSPDKTAATPTNSAAAEAQGEQLLTPDADPELLKGIENSFQDHAPVVIAAQNRLKELLDKLNSSTNDSKTETWKDQCHEHIETIEKALKDSKYIVNNSDLLPLYKYIDTYVDPKDIKIPAVKIRNIFISIFKKIINDIFNPSMMQSGSNIASLSKIIKYLLILGYSPKNIKDEVAKQLQPKTPIFIDADLHDLLCNQIKLDAAQLAFFKLKTIDEKVGNKRKADTALASVATASASSSSVATTFGTTSNTQAVTNNSAGTAAVSGDTKDQKQPLSTASASGSTSSSTKMSPEEEKAIIEMINSFYDAADLYELASNLTTSNPELEFRALQRAVRLNPNHFVSHIQLARFYSQKKANQATALEHYGIAIKGFLDNAKLYLIGDAKTKPDQNLAFKFITQAESYINKISKISGNAIVLNIALHAHYFYCNGIGTPINLKKAADIEFFLEKLITDPQQQFNVACSLLNGNVVPSNELNDAIHYNETFAIKWLRKAAAQYHIPASCFLVVFDTPLAKRAQLLTQLNDIKNSVSEFLYIFLNENGFYGIPIDENKITQLKDHAFKNKNPLMTYYFSKEQVANLNEEQSIQYKSMILEISEIINLYSQGLRSPGKKEITAALTRCKLLSPKFLMLLPANDKTTVTASVSSAGSSASGGDLAKKAVFQNDFASTHEIFPVLPAFTSQAFGAGFASIEKQDFLPPIGNLDFDSKSAGTTGHASSSASASASTSSSGTLPPQKSDAKVSDSASAAALASGAAGNSSPAFSSHHDDLELAATIAASKQDAKAMAAIQTNDDDNDPDLAAAKRLSLM